jgi:catechol 2,3-dioxygenase-like lactoylglutathione lyase family enzyme
MLRTTGIAHFTLGVSDIARSVDFYTNVVGMQLVSRNGDRMAFLRSGKDHLVIVKAEPGSEKPIVMHQAFIVESADFEAGVRFLQSRNIAIEQQDERTGNDSVFVGRSAYFRDPDGNPLEIIDLQRTAHRPIASKQPSPN